MAIHKGLNFNFKPSIKGIKFQSGDVFVGCNICQKYPGTKVFESLKDLAFVRCNLINCDLPDDSKTKLCNAAKISFCYWENPYMGLEPEEENCVHVTETIPPVVIDKVEVATAQYKRTENLAIGKKEYEVLDEKTVDDISKILRSK
jgi:hypothetical protein